MGKKLEKIGHVLTLHELKVPFIISGCALLVIGAIFIPPLFKSKDDIPEEKDENVYLNEEVCYAGGVYIKANSISVDKIIEQAGSFDSDGEELSQYTLNLGVEIERRVENKKLSNIEFKPSSFSLKNVNLEAKSKMGVFIESLAQETFSALLNIGTGSINIIEETINFVGEYATASIENSQFKSDFKKIKCDKDSFDSLKTEECNKKYSVCLKFPIKQEYLESKNIIVLSIDHWNHVEKKIFLTKRPTTV